MPGEGKAGYEHYYSRRGLWYQKWEGTVVRNYNVASFIKEFVIEIPEDMNYKAGGYIQIEIPECEIKFEDIDITAHPEEHDDPKNFKKNGTNLDFGH